MDGASRPVLPEHLEKARTRIGVGFKKIHNPIGSYGARTFAPLGVDNTLVLDDFRAAFQVHISHSAHEDTIFDLVHIDAPIANALRRILLVEVPSMAIEIVRFLDNTSIMHDEMLAHRLGLVPLHIDPRPFDIRQPSDPISFRNTVYFRLRVRCEVNRGAPNDSEAPPSLLYKNHKVLSSDIAHLPFPGSEAKQVAMFGDTPPGPVHNDITLCKLRPGQEVHVEMEATKNIGKEHAKWSPVATATYRMLPEISLRNPVTGTDAETLVKMCPANVFDIEDDAAVVARPRDCTMCRECIRQPEWEQRVELARKRDHFIFHVESTGALPASTLVTEALSVLITKCDTMLDSLGAAMKRRSSAAAANTVILEDADIDVLMGDGDSRR